MSFLPVKMHIYTTIICQKFSHQNQSFSYKLYEFCSFYFICIRFFSASSIKICFCSKWRIYVYEFYSSIFLDLLLEFSVLEKCFEYLEIVSEYEFIAPLIIFHTSEYFSTLKWHRPSLCDDILLSLLASIIQRVFLLDDFFLFDSFQIVKRYGLSSFEKIDDSEYFIFREWRNFRHKKGNQEIDCPSFFGIDL